MMVESCREQRELLAEWALGRLEGAEADELVAHLAACEACSAEAGELTEVAAALRLADSARVTGGAAPQPPPELGATVRRRIADEMAQEREVARRRRSRLVLSGLSAAAVVVLSVVVAVGGWLIGPDDDYVTVQTLETAEGLEAAMDAYDYGWGASLRITASGLEDDAVYEVWVEDRDGVRRSAGTFRGIADTEINCTMASATRLYEADRFGIDGPEGERIFRGRVADEPRTASR